MAYLLCIGVGLMLYPMWRIYGYPLMCRHLHKVLRRMTQ